MIHDAPYKMIHRSSSHAPITGHRLANVGRGLAALTAAALTACEMNESTGIDSRSLLITSLLCEGGYNIE